MYQAVYVQCSGPEFYQGVYCPFDGSGNAITRLIDETVSKLREKGLDLTHANLENAGIPADVLSGVIIITFPSRKCAWDVFSPVREAFCAKCGGKLSVLRL